MAGRHCRISKREEMKDFLKIVIISLLIFFGIIYIEERETLVYPFVGWVKPKPAAPLDRDRIAKIIIDFNKTLVEAYEKSNVAILKGADEEVKGQINFEIAFLHAKGWSFIPKFSRMDVSDVRFEDNKLKVITSEDWNIRVLDHKKQEERFKDETYKMIYTLEKNGEAWLITTIYPERENPAKPRANG